MRRSPLQVLLLLAAAGAGLAALVTIQSQGKTGAEFRPEKLFPALDLDRIVRIEIVTAGETTTLSASDGLWGLDSRAGYPVDAEKLRRLVLGVASLTPSDRMTDKPEKYARMGVASVQPSDEISDEASAEASSDRVRLLDADGNVLADLYLGDEREGKSRGPGGFSATRGQYVRVEGDPWVYLIADEIRIEDAADRWLERDVVDIAEADLVQISIDHGDSTETLTIARAAADAFEITTTIPEGYEATTWAVRSVARALGDLRLEDVLSVDDESSKELDFGVRYVAVSRKGVEYAAATAQDEDRRYLKLSAVAGDGAKSPSLIETKSESETESEIEIESEIEAPKSGNDAATTGSAEAGTGESATSEEISESEESGEIAAAEFNQRHSPWIYVISNPKYLGLTKKLSDLIEEKEPEPETPPETGAQSGLGADADPEAAEEAADGAMTNPEPNGETP